jgi:uncharacterized Fe-S cluster protein YjdI
MSQKTYTNGEVIVHWDVSKCIHSGNCVRNLKEVFKPKEKPWVQMENGTTEQIKSAIDKCPSGALRYEENK